MTGLLTLCLVFLQTGDAKPAISNVHPTLGALGAVRPEAPYLPGDLVHVAFDVAGLKLDAEGRYRVAAKLTVEDAAGKTITTEDYGAIPPRLGILAGGKSRFAFRYLIPFDLQAGSYKAKLALIDVHSKQEALVEQAFKVSPPGFGLVRFQSGRGPYGQAETPPTGVLGEVLYLRMMAIGLSKGKEGLASLEFTLDVQDTLGKPLGKPQQSRFPNVNPDEPLTLQFELPLDRVGRYQVVIKATDQGSGRTASLTVPITIVE
jgi:hypothetical protein